MRNTAYENEKCTPMNHSSKFWLEKVYIRPKHKVILCNLREDLAH